MPKVKDAVDFIISGQYSRIEFDTLPIKEQLALMYELGNNYYGAIQFINKIKKYNGKQGNKIQG